MRTLDHRTGNAPERLVGLAQHRVTTMHGAHALALIGPVMHAALVAQEVLSLLAEQDESIDPRRFTQLARDAWDVLASVTA